MWSANAVGAKTDRPSDHRRRHAVVGGVSLLLGLLVFMRGSWLSAIWRDVIGDALWATMLASGVSLLLPYHRPVLRYATALALCCAVEFSQRWHAPLLDAVRATWVGHLFLGSGFDPRDLVAYALGVLLFVVFDQWWVRGEGVR